MRFPPPLKECDTNTRLVYTGIIDIVLTTIVALMMPVGILGGYYNNIIIHSPTTWYSAPPELLAWCPILDGIFFIVAFVAIYIALWAKTLEIDN